MHEIVILRQASAEPSLWACDEAVDGQGHLQNDPSHAHLLVLYLTDSSEGIAGGFLVFGDRVELRSAGL